jgi:hypothetical protein
MVIIYFCPQIKNSEHYYTRTELHLLLIEMQIIPEKKEKKNSNKDKEEKILTDKRHKDLCRVALWGKNPPWYCRNHSFVIELLALSPTELLPISSLFSQNDSLHATVHQYMIINNK